MIITALFFSAILAIGIFSFFKVKTKEDYLVAGRRAGGLAVGSSLAATILGGSLALAGKLCASNALVAASFLLSLIIYSVDRLWQIKFNLEKRFI